MSKKRKKRKKWPCALGDVVVLTDYHRQRETRPVPPPVVSAYRVTNLTDRIVQLAPAYDPENPDEFEAWVYPVKRNRLAERMQAGEVQVFSMHRIHCTPKRVKFLGWGKL